VAIPSQLEGNRQPVPKVVGDGGKRDRDSSRTHRHRWQGPEVSITLTTGHSPGAAPGGSGPAAAALVEIVVPVHNEERSLASCVRVLHTYLRDHFPFEATITIADNASTDATPQLARTLAEELPGVRVLRLEDKGRGRALRAAWSASDADVVAYLDVDLSTGLDALLPLVAPLVTGHSDLAIGSRLAPGSRTVRCTKRELISRGYNALVQLSHGASFSDALVAAEHVLVNDQPGCVQRDTAGVEQRGIAKAEFTIDVNIS
jgi:Glycosyl transferase family 2